MTALTSTQKSPPDMQGSLEDWCHLWGVDGLSTEIRVEISTRMTRSLGRCYPDRKLIRIASFVLQESEELFQEVLCHETAHLAAYRLHGRSIRPHGREWKALMATAGYEPAVRFKGLGVQPAPAVAKQKKGLMGPLLDLLGILPPERARSIAFKRLGAKYRRGR